MQSQRSKNATMTQNTKPTSPTQLSSSCTRIINNNPVRPTIYSTIMSSRITTRAMTAATSFSNAGGAPTTAKTSSNAKDHQTGRAPAAKGKRKKRKTTHTAVAMPDPRAPKKARSGYELFLLAGGVDFHVINKKMDLKEFKRLNDRWQRMAEDDRTTWAGQGVLDRIRFAAEMEMYHGSGTVQAMGSDFSLQLQAQDIKKMKEREDKAKHIAACTLLQVVEMKKKQKMAALVSPGLVTLDFPASSTPATSIATDASATGTDISTISTPVSSNKTIDPKGLYSATVAPALAELSSDSSFSDNDPDEVIV